MTSRSLIRLAVAIGALAVFLGMPGRDVGAEDDGMRAELSLLEVHTSAGIACTTNRSETPPFYAFSPLVPGITLTFGGIMIDMAARALEPDGRLIPGLYAAGECGGAAFFHDYIGGGALTNALVMGRIAGRGAAG